MSNGQRSYLSTASTWSCLNVYILYKNYSKEKKSYGKFCLEIVKHLLKNAKEMLRGVLEIPEPANSPLQISTEAFH